MSRKMHLAGNEIFISAQPQEQKERVLKMLAEAIEKAKTENQFVATAKLMFLKKRYEKEL